MPDALVEVWQADADGALPHRSRRRLHRLRPLPDRRRRRFPFTTVKPGAVDAARRPTSTCRSSPGACCSGSSTRVYFPDETDANAADPVLASIDDDHGAPRWSPRPTSDGLAFDVRLQGPRARRCSSSAERRPCPLPALFGPIFVSRRPSRRRRRTTRWCRRCSTPRPRWPRPRPTCGCVPPRRPRPSRPRAGRPLRRRRARPGGPAGGNPVIPLVAALLERRRWRRRPRCTTGATSQDILDTAADARRRRAPSTSSLVDLAGSPTSTADLAERHRHTLMAGRTLLQQALPTTFGLKAAGWLSAVLEVADGCAWVRGAGSAVQLGGAAGHAGVLGDRRARGRRPAWPPGSGWRCRCCRGTPPAPASPSWPRRSASVAGARRKIALDVALLAQTEVAEVAEPAGPGRGGRRRCRTSRTRSARSWSPPPAVAPTPCGRSSAPWRRSTSGRPGRGRPSGPRSASCSRFAGGGGRPRGQRLDGLGSTPSHGPEPRGERWDVHGRACSRGARAGVGSGRGRRRVEQPPGQRQASPGPAGRLRRGRGPRRRAAGHPARPLHLPRCRRAWTDRALAAYRKDRRCCRPTGSTAPPARPSSMLGSSLGTTGDLWAPQMPMLTQRFRVVRYEHPGHGHSRGKRQRRGAPARGGSAAARARLHGAEESARPAGHDRGPRRRRRRAARRPRRRTSVPGGISLGGMVSMWVAAHAPDRVDRVVLACTAAHLPPASAWHERADPSAARALTHCARRCWPAGSRRASRPPGPTSSNPSPPCWPPPIPRATPPAARRSPGWTSGATSLPSSPRR